MTVLLPFGFTSIVDLPYSVHEALRLALVFISWDELESEERPRKAIWFEPDELAKHWKAVEERRKAKWGTGSDGDIRDEPIDGPWERNAAADDLVR